MQGSICNKGGGMMMVEQRQPRLMITSHGTFHDHENDRSIQGGVVLSGSKIDRRACLSKMTDKV